MSHVPLNEYIETALHSAAVAAGTTDIEPANGVDTADCESVRFLVQFGAITATAVTTIKLQQSDDSDGSPDAFSDLAGTGLSVADDDDGKVFCVEVVNPQKRYVRCVVDRGTANAVVDAIISEKGGLRSLPATNANSETTVSPAEGTA